MVYGRGGIKMIDENKLIKDLRKIDTMYSNELMEIGATENKELMMECVHNQPKVDNWIPCNEYFPNEKDIKDNTELLVTMDSGEVTTLCWTNNPESYFYDRTTDDVYSPYNEVIAWQQLPKGYKVE